MFQFRNGSSVAVILALCAAVSISFAQDKQAVPESAATAEDPAALLSSIVRIKVKAVADARSSATLGREREGTGIQIDDRGHIVTIGYIVIEPDSIEITTADNKTVAATLVGYDHATGFGLLRASAPTGAKPIALGESSKIGEREPVMVLPFGGRETATLARVVSTRAFTASWEYQLESAIFTSPPTMAWAGAALINRDAKLVGVGSLLVRDSSGGGRGEPGNMFVPIDTLKPILADLIKDGKRAGPQRPWLGLATEEMQGRLFVSRVSPDSPADKAGIRQGDIVLGVSGASVKSHADLYGKMWGLGAAGVDVPLKILQGAELRDINVRSIDRFEYFRAKPIL